MTQLTPRPFVEKVFVTKKETAYFWIALIFSTVINLTLLICTFVVGYLTIAFYVWLSLFIIQGISLGYIKQNSVKITPNQFSNIYEKAHDIAFNMNIQNTPEIYLMQSNGILNAFATRFLFKDYLVLYSDIMELALEEGEDAVNFVIAHELAHVKRKHLSKQIWIFWGLFCPYLGSAYSRACETTCDNIAAYFVPDESASGLLALIAGKKLYKHVNIKDMLETSNRNYGFWAWISEINSSHPALSKRIYNILRITETVTGKKNELLGNSRKFVLSSDMQVVIFILIILPIILCILGIFAVLLLPYFLAA